MLKCHGWFPLCPSSLAFAFRRYWPGTPDWSVLAIAGSRVRRRRAISSWLGLRPLLNGVVRCVSNARSKSSFFIIISFRVLTARSASPFACGYFGELVVCVNPYVFANYIRDTIYREYLFQHIDCMFRRQTGQLSELNPSWVVVKNDYVNFAIQFKQVYSNPPPWTRGKRSCHQSFFRLWSDLCGHMWHVDTISSISFERPGHQTAVFALDRHFDMPRRPSCMTLGVSSRM